MKRTMLTLTLALLTSSAFAAVCQKPNEYAASAFKIIEAPATQDLETYLRNYTVARTAVNEKCEDMYMVALKTKNESARLLLEKIGYGPKNAKDLNDTRYNSYMSYNDYAMAYASSSLIREFKTRGGESYNALYYAASFNTIEVIDWLLAEKKASPDDVITFAVTSNKKSVIEQLIRRGANVSKDGVVQASITRADKEIIELLVRSGAPLSDPKIMAQAAASNTIETFEFLARAGGVVNANILESAILAGRIDMVKYIVSFGIKPTERLDNGKTLLMSALTSAKIEIVDYLIKEGLDVFAIDYDGNNAFAYTKDISMIKFLKEKGVDINLLNKKGFSPLQNAIKKGDSYSVYALAKGGADTNLPTGLGVYPIHLVFNETDSCHSPALMISYLIDAGANINQKNKEGYTPLMRAAMISGCGSSEMASSSKGIGNDLIKYLLLKHPDKNVKVKEGRSRQSAQDLYGNYNNSDPEIYKLLED